MRKIYFTSLVFSFFLYAGRAQSVYFFHPFVTDSSGKLAPWYNPDPRIAYDHDLQLIWNFWNNIPYSASSGAKYYMTDHSYSPGGSGNMVGGDQFAMALSSWGQYYAYTGDTALIENMVYIAKTYLSHSLSAASAVWPNIPYPCNSSVPSFPIYDGDFILGPNYTQPDKACSFAAELITLFKITHDSSYLQTAINIANTVAPKIQPGDTSNSPYPFKVNAVTGGGGGGGLINYTGNVTPALRLFEGLINLGLGDTALYDSAYVTIKTWVQKCPQKTNNWGCFFEDIVGYSNTEINAVTMARYILLHPNWDSTWQQDARNILDWTYATFADTVWHQYGVTAIYEQTADYKPGGSHTSRYAAAELLYAQKTGDTSRVEQAIRQLNWATYLCDSIGLCRFSPSEGSEWYTDGYGDYVRHFIHAMASYPAIAPSTANHLLGSTSVITYIKYQPLEINYTTYNKWAIENLRLTSKPVQVKANGIALAEQSNPNTEGWVWTPMATGGTLSIKHTNSTAIDILWSGLTVNSVAPDEDLIQLFPNPASGTVTVKYMVPVQQAGQIDLYDMAGRLVRQINVNENQLVHTEQLNIADLQPGIYFVKLVLQNGQTVKKLVVAR